VTIPFESRGKRRAGLAACNAFRHVRDGFSFGSAEALLVRRRQRLADNIWKGASMSKLQKLLLGAAGVFPLVSGTAALVSMSACDGGAEEAGEKIDDAVEEAGDKIEDATDK
jgi:hypothetical protein